MMMVVGSNRRSHPFHTKLRKQPVHTMNCVCVSHPRSLISTQIITLIAYYLHCLYLYMFGVYASDLDYARAHTPRHVRATRTLTHLSFIDRVHAHILWHTVRRAADRLVERRRRRRRRPDGTNLISKCTVYSIPADREVSSRAVCPNRDIGTSHVFFCACAVRECFACAQIN